MVEPLSPNRRASIFNSKKELQFRTGQFVQENLESFYSVYTKNSAPIGSGAFAEVWICTHKRSGEIRAVKILLKAGISDQDIKNRTVFMEVEILKTLDHPNVVKVYEYFEDDQQYYIVMEYCDGGDVFDKIESAGPLTERYAAKIMKFLLSGLCYLHSKQVVHRDIKPENLLMINSNNYTDMSIKIIDFNIATKKEGTKLKGVSGTTDYIAPEVFRGVYDEKCDIWSSGVILYIMMSRNLPFPSENDEVAEKAICAGKFSFPPDLFRNISQDCKNFITKLMTKNPCARPSAREALEDPWLKIAYEACDRQTFTKTITRLKTLKEETSKLKELFTTFMISQLSKSSSVKKLEQVFYSIDVNRDGVISVQELVEQLSKEMSAEEALEQAKTIMQAVDRNGTGEIDYTEYLRVTIDEDTLLTKENLKKAFCYFDKDRSDSIEKEELKSWLSTGDIIPESIIAELMQEADINGDGTIDITEFEALLISKLDIESPTAD